MAWFRSAYTRSRVKVAERMSTLTLSGVVRVRLDALAQVVCLLRVAKSQTMSGDSDAESGRVPPIASSNKRWTETRT